MESKVPMKLKLVISGGQSGADLAGVQFFRSIGCDTKINTFHGFEEWLHNKGDEDLLFSFDINYVEPQAPPADDIALLRFRTHYNVQNSDGTIIFVTKPINSTRGSRLTRRYCEECHKPYFIFNLHENPSSQILRCTEYLINLNPETLNIAGERFCDPATVIAMLRSVWNRVGEDENANRKSSCKLQSLQ